MTVDIQVVRQSISKIVGLLTRQAIRVTQRGTKAFVQYNIKTGAIELVNIPYLPDDASEDFVAAVQGFLDHEVGHVLFTDVNVIKKAAKHSQRLKNLHNVIEDVFVERKMTEAFPGSGANLESTRRFYLQKIAKVKIEAALAAGDEAAAAGYASVVQFRAWGGQKIAQDFLSDNPRYAKLLDSMVAKVGSFVPAELMRLNSSADSLKLAEKLLTLLTPPPPPPAPPPPPPPPAPAPPAPPAPTGSSSAADDEDDTPDEDDSEKDEAEDEGTSGAETDDSGIERDTASATDEASDEAGTKGGEDGGDREGELDDDATAAPEIPRDEKSLDFGDFDPKAPPEPEDEDEKERGSPTAGSDERGDPGFDGDDTGDDDDSADDEPAGVGSADEGEDEGEGDSADEGDSYGDKDGPRFTPPSESEADLTEHDDDDDNVEEPESPASLFDEARDFDDDMSKALSDAAKVEAKDSDYQIFSTDWDRVETAPPCNNPESVVKMIDATQHMISGIQKSLERAMAAKARKTWNPGQRRGRISPGALFRTVTGDDRVFRTRYETHAKDTTVSLLIDCSGSMQSMDRIGTAGRAAFALSSTLERLKVKHEIIGFTTKRSTQMVSAINQEGGGFNYARSESLYMPVFKTFAERLNVDVKSRLAHLTERPSWLRENVDGECVQLAAHRLMTQTSERHVLLVLSDGEPACPGGYVQLERHLKKVCKTIEDNRQVELVGIGIQSNAVRQFYKKNVVLNDLQELPTTVIGQLSKVLLTD